MRYFTEEELKNYYKKVIEEGEYATEFTVGEYSTPQDANAVLNAVRKQYGFGRYDSWVDGTTVKVVIEKDRYDSDYFYDMMNDLKSYSAQYKQVDESVEERLRDERGEVNVHPTEGQAKAGNYKMGHITIHGFEISIENPKGSYRCGKDKDGKAWKTYMHNDYGYFNRTVGKDGDAIDVFLGPNLNSQKIFAVDQYLGGEFDETKVMMGFDTKEEAKAAYLSNYDKNWKGFKYITEVDIDTFKKWLYDGYRQRKAFAKYVRLTESILKEDFFEDKMVDVYGEHTIYDLLQEFENNKRNGISQKQWNLIPAAQYQTLLRRYMSMGEMARIPENIVSRWFEDIIIPNAVDIEYITELAGHSQYFPGEDVADFYGTEISDYDDGGEYLDECGFYDWCKFPDGSDAWSDYGLSPIFKIIQEYNPSLSGAEILILINRVLDIVHCRGNLASAFIEGGRRTCWDISNDNTLNENSMKTEWTTRDILNIYNNQPMKGYDYWAYQASKWGRARIGNYGDASKIQYPPVKYANNKFYVFCDNDWIEVPFDYSTLNKEFIDSGRLMENKGRKIYLTEAQFKNYCRTLLKEKRKEEYIKKLINETKKPQ